MDDLTGTDFGSYTITRLIRQFGDRTIYAAEHSLSGRTDRLDLFSNRLEENSPAARSFLQRASDAAQLVHPNAATVYDAGIVDGTPYVASQYEDTPDLDALRDELPWPPTRSLAILQQIASAIDAAHKVGLTHGALRPDTIQVDANDLVLVTGFGIQAAELTDAGDDTTDAVWQTPEQITGDGAGQATDIYQLGMVAYLLLTGRAPFGRQFTGNPNDAHLHEIPPPMHELNPALGPRASLVGQTAMAKRPDDRYATAAEFIDQLRQTIQSAAIAGDSPFSSAANGPVSDDTVELFPSPAQRRRQATVGQQAALTWGQSATKIRFIAGGCLIALVVVLAAGLGAATAFSMIGSDERPTPTTPADIVIYATFTATPTLEPRPTRTLPPPVPTATSTQTPTPTATPTGANSSAQSTIPPFSTAPASVSPTGEASDTPTQQSTPTTEPTAEPTATPTPTAVQAAAAPDDGEVQYDRPLNEWRNDEFSQGWIRPQTSTLLIGVYGESSGQTMQAWTFINDWDDISVSVDVRATTTGLEAAGCVALRHNVNQGEYQLCLFATGETNATYNSVSGGQTVELLEMEERSATRPPQSWNTLKIVAEGDDFWFYANGELLGHAEHSGRSQGSAAIQVTNWDTDEAEFEFRNLVVRDVD